MDNKKDYTKYQGQRNNIKPLDEATNEKLVASEVVETEPVVEEEFLETVDKAAKTECDAEENNNVIGIVIGCKMLNIRKSPSKDSDPVCTVDSGEELNINLSDSTDAWYSVSTSTGVKGFCMKEFVAVN